MRQRVYFDPQDLDRLIDEELYPTIRQSFDELRGSGNVDIFLWGEHDEKYIKEFLDRHLVEDLVDGFYLTKDRAKTTRTDGDVIVDSTPEAFEDDNHIQLIDSLDPVIAWFVPKSKLLDPIYRTVNSAPFIKFMKGVLEYMHVQGVTIDGTAPHYRLLEQCYMDLMSELQNRPNQATIRSDSFVVERGERIFTCKYEGS